MITKYNDGCFRISGRTITEADINEIHEEAQKAKLRRARICCHYDINDPLQEMFVFMMQDSFKGIYKYAKAASLLLLRGHMEYHFFTDDGELTASYDLSETQPFIKIEAGVYHHPALLSPYVLIHETHLGPWQGEIERIQKKPGIVWPPQEMCG